MIENWRLKYVITQNHAACEILTHHAASVRDLANIVITYMYSYIMRLSYESLIMTHY